MATSKRTFWKWLNDSGYHANFFIGVCSGIATYVALKAEGLHIFTSLDAFLSWASFLLFFLAIYLFGAFLLYKSPFAILLDVYAVFRKVVLIFTFKKLIDIVLWIFSILLPSVVLLYGLLFYLFGGLSALNQKDIQIYTTLLSLSFTLAGFSMTTAAFLWKSKSKSDKKFFMHAAFFALSGLLLFSNILVAQFTEQEISSSAIVEKAFNFFLLSGGIGIMIFFLVLASMVHLLIDIAIHSNNPKP